MKKLCLKIPQNSQENTCTGVYFLIRLAVWKKDLWTAAKEVTSSERLNNTVRQKNSLR